MPESTIASSAWRTFVRERFEHHQRLPTCPAPADVEAWFEDLVGLLLPEYLAKPLQNEAAFMAFAASLQDRCVALVDRCPAGGPARSHRVTDALFARLPQVHAMVDEDVDAMLRGDPAARNRDEVVRTYPGVRAMVAHRVGRALWDLGVPLFARMVAEYAHRMTGIDIHPAASIGRRFCIDHGTGIVIGATAVVGDDVKIYQGVTLGGLSVRKRDADVKRHPTIEDRVVLYAGATVLGGDTVVGHDTVVGGNVWLTESVPPFSKLTYTASLETRVVTRDAAPTG